MIEFSVPVPPSTNNLFVNVTGRGRVRTQRYRTWMQAALHDVPKVDRLEGDIVVQYRVPPNNRRDLDNYLKALNDLLVTGGLIVDDRRIVDIRITRDVLGNDMRRATVCLYSK